MKVLIMSPHLHIKGGATRLVISLARYLMKKGEDVEVWSHEVNIENTFKEARYLTIRDISRPYLNIRGTSRPYLNYISAYVFPPSEIREFDIINCHNFPSYLVALNRKVKGKPIIWHCNEPPLELYPVPQQGPKSTILQLLKLIRPLEKTAVRKLSYITVHGKMMENRVRKIYGRRPLILGPLGIDIDKFKSNPKINIRAKYNIGDAPCIMTVAAFNKRLDLLLNIFSKVNKLFRDAKLLLVGASYQNTTLNALKNMIKNLNLEQNVILAPNVNDEDLPSYYSACDIFVFPQPYWGFSLVVMEAMASGKPVVVPDTCAAAEIINGRNGIVVDITNPSKTAEEIVKLIRNDDKRKEMGIAARKYAEEFLDMNRFLDRYHKLFQESLCKR